MTILEKVAYLRGLSEGLGIDDQSKEGRMFKGIIDILDDMALTVSDLEDDVAEISDGLDEIDEDLGALEDEFYADEEDDDELFNEDELYEVTCPSCGDAIYVNEDMLDEGFIHCPSCNEKLEFDFECDCGEDCECNHEHE